MPWYSNRISDQSRTWVYNATNTGVTTGRSQGTPQDPVTNANYRGSSGTGSISYLENNPIYFKSTKTYYFETLVSNLTDWYNESGATENPWKILRMWIGNFDGVNNGNVDFWQGSTKVIDYVGFKGKTPGQISNTYPVDTTPSLIQSNSDTNDQNNQIKLQFFSRPTNDFVSEKIIEYNTSGQSLNPKYGICRYQSNRLFGDKNWNDATNYPAKSAFIRRVETNEIDFIVQGWAVYKEKDFGLAPDGVIGWVYDGGTYSWRTWATASFNNILHAMAPVTTEQDKALALYGDSNIDIVVSSPRWSINNFIGIELEAGQVFNLEFDLIFSTQSGISPIKLYIGTELPTSYTSSPTRGLLIGSFTVSNKYTFYNLNGGNYLYFVGSTVSTNTITQVGVSADIGNISVVSGYSEVDNNKLFAFQSTSLPYNEPTPLSIIGSATESTYESTSITPLTVHETNSGPVGSKRLTFNQSSDTSLRTPLASSILNNVINNIISQGILQPTSTALASGFSTFGFFSNIYGTVSNLSVLNSKVGNGKFKAGVWENGVWNSGWRVDENVYEFNDISLSFSLRTENVRWRIQIEGSTYSVSKFEVGDRISIGNIVAININEERKLLKNYFTIVNKSDTSLIVEVDNVFPIRRIKKDSENHKILVTKNVWLNGGFLNGYFKGVWNDGLFKGFPLITEMYNSHWVDGKFDGGHFYAEKPSYVFGDTYYWEGYVGLTGATAHNMLPGDLINIDKFDKEINPQYDGDYKVTKVIDDYLLITDIPWGDNSSNESGLVTRRTSTGLIQNFNFYDNNYSRYTSRNSRNLKEIWRYGSWIDVNYSDQSTTNINSSRIYNNRKTTNFLQWRDRHRFGIGDYGVLNLHGYITEDVLSSVSYFRGLDSTAKRAYNLGTKYEIYEDFLGDVSNFNNPFNSDPEEGTLDNFYADGWTFSFSGISGGTFSYINSIIKKSNANSTLSSTNTSPSWSNISFNTEVENSFGALINASSPTEWQILTTGNYDISINLPSTKFYTFANTNGLEGGNFGNDYLFLSGNIVVGRIRIIRVRNNTQEILLERVIKTSGSDFYNVGTTRFPEGEDSGSYQRTFNLEVDWKGDLQLNDVIRVQFQSCDTRITNYNAGGPWRGSGFEQGVGLNDNITQVISTWTLNSNRTIRISNSGVGSSPGYNFKRTTEGTLLVEHGEDSFHSLTLNNSLIDIPRNRYSMIEFDLIQAPSTLYEPLGESYSFHFTDLYNFTTFINSDLSYSSTPAFPSAPVKLQRIIGSDSFVTENPTSKTPLWSGIDYTKTKNTKKVEYFFNRPGLDLGLLAEQGSIFRDQVHEIDNIKFYEVDMIPFFQYTTKEYVDRSIKIPYQGKAPFINFEDRGVSFVESLNTGVDSIEIQQTMGTFKSSLNTPFIFTPPRIEAGQTNNTSISPNLFVSSVQSQTFNNNFGI